MPELGSSPNFGKSLANSRSLTSLRNSVRVVERRCRRMMMLVGMTALMMAHAMRRSAVSTLRAHARRHCGLLPDVSRPAVRFSRTRLPACVNRRVAARGTGGPCQRRQRHVSGFSGHSFPNYPEFGEEPNSGMRPPCACSHHFTYAPLGGVGSQRLIFVVMITTPLDPASP